MDTKHSGPLEAVAAAIAAHLQAHPLAADSAEGVARWWVGGECAGLGIEEVEAALELLVERRQLRRLRLIDGTALYSQHVASRQ